MDGAETKPGSQPIPCLGWAKLTGRHLAIQTLCVCQIGGAFDVGLLAHRAFPFFGAN
jgi:hypothetical protein